jgi:hypothetical protein
MTRFWQIDADDKRLLDEAKEMVANAITKAPAKRRSIERRLVNAYRGTRNPPRPHELED